MKWNCKSLLLLILETYVSIELGEVNETDIVSRCPVGNPNRYRN